MRKRTSRRRWKARALRGQKIPWSTIVEHRLEKWKTWERHPQWEYAFLPDVLSETSFEAALCKLRAAGFVAGVSMIRGGPFKLREIPHEDLYL